MFKNLSSSPLRFDCFFHYRSKLMNNMRSFIYFSIEAKYEEEKLKNKCDKTIGKFLRLSRGNLLMSSLLIFRCACEGNSVAKLRVNLFL